MGFILDKERAREITKKSISMLESRVFPFDIDRMPDKIVPEGIDANGLEHAFLIFYACSIDSMRQAKEVYQAIRQISNEADLRNMFALSEERVKILLDKHLEDSSENTMGNPSKTIVENSMRLYMDYQNNPLNIKRDGVDETLKELDKFRQVGPGKAALIMKNFVRFGSWNFPVYELPMKIDRHVIRISLGTGVVKTDEEVIRADKIMKPLMNLYREITREEKISGVDLDDAMWVIGSYICLKNNKSYCDINCPLGCEKRPPSDDNAVFFQPQVDKRKGKGQGSLFGI